jgi:hypothetical protein
LHARSPAVGLDPLKHELHRPDGENRWSVVQPLLLVCRL